MTEAELQVRTKQFAIRVIKLCEALPKVQSAVIVANQLLRSATSVGANYRAACRARSRADWINKLGIVIEEADESGYWLELIVESGLMSQSKISALLKEANELTAIFTASQMTSKHNAPLAKANQKHLHCIRSAVQVSEIRNQK
jgi:four helix bundle protein